MASQQQAFHDTAIIAALYINDRLCYHLIRASCAMVALPTVNVAIDCHPNAVVYGERLSKSPKIMKSVASVTHRDGNHTCVHQPANAAAGCTERLGVLHYRNYAD